MRAYLKIKIVSLAAEARLIRGDERRYRRLSGNSKAKAETRQRALSTWVCLRQHRIIEVRREARSACLAYGFLRGRAYHQLESKCYTEPNWARVKAIALKYGDGPNLEARFKAWREAAWSAPAAPDKAA